MAIYDRKFDILHPSFDRLDIQNLEVANLELLNPVSDSVVPLIDGELVQIGANYQFVRGTTANFAQPSFFAVEDRGSHNVRASRKLAAVMGGTFTADTLVWDGAPALGGALEMATITDARFGGVARAGLQPVTTGLVIGYCTKLPAINGGRLRFIQTAV